MNRGLDPAEAAAWTRDQKRRVARSMVTRRKLRPRGRNRAAGKRTNG